MAPARITPQMDIKSAEGVNNWAVPGPAEFDFRSDVVTTPTSSMLAAIQRTTLLDDVFGEDPTTTSLEAFMADLTGHEAGLLVLSGTMGNQISLRTHLTSPPHSILTPQGSHILIHEAGGVASLTGALVTPVPPSSPPHLSLADLRAHAVLGSDIHSCPTRLISLENTLNGEILPLATCVAIADWARALAPPLKLHLDGARLWEACVAVSVEGGPEPATVLRQYAACFDSVSLCFSKGLGAPIGSVVVGSAEFVRKARWVRKSIGGGLRQAGVISAAARASVEETFLGGRLGACHIRAKEIARLWEARGGKVTKKTETNMVWFDLEAAGCEVPHFVEVGKRHGVRFMGGRVVVHYQISDEAVQRLVRVMDEILGPESETAMKNGANGTGGKKEELEGVKEESEGTKEVDGFSEVQL